MSAPQPLVGGNSAVRSLSAWGALAAIVAVLGGCTGDAPGSGTVRVGFIQQGEPARVGLRGAELGAEEAAHAGRLVGRSLSLLTERAETPDQAAAAARRLIDRGVVAIVGGGDEESCSALAEIAERRRVLFLNVGCRADALRSDRLRYSLHVEASESMYDATLAEAGHGAVLWHGGLTRYGAAQLNDRFQRRFGASPGASDWAGWMAVKVVWESLARTGAADAPSLLAFLEAEETRFDGHKGEPLGFEPRSRQLLQPLYPLVPGAAGDREASPATAGLPDASRVPLTAAEYLFVSNEGSLDVTVVDASSLRPVARIPLTQRPRGIHASPDGKRLYVALSDHAPTAESDGDAVVVVDLERGREVARYSAGSDPEQFGITPDGRRLYASNEDAGTATATDLVSGREMGTVVVGIEPEGVAVSPDGRWVYVTAESSNTVSVIDTRVDEVVASFLVDVRPRGVAFSPTRARAYVTNEISGTVSVVDTRAHQVVATVDLGAGAKPVGVVVSPDGRRVYVANGHQHTIAVIDAASDQVVARVPVGRRPWGIALSGTGDRIYTANGGSDDVSVIDAATLRVIETVAVGQRPWGVAVVSRSR